MLPLLSRLSFSSSSPLTVCGTGSSSWEPEPELSASVFEGAKWNTSQNSQRGRCKLKHGVLGYKSEVDFPQVIRGSGNQNASPTPIPEKAQGFKHF